jgi:hypothetical protein
MIKIKNKSALTVVTAAILLSAFATGILPIANATDIQLYVFVVASPNPIGVNQNVLIAMWADLLPPINSSSGAGTGWTGWMLTITHPDGTTETMGPYNSDSVGSKSLIYVPKQTGTYYFQFTSPQQTQQYAAAGNVYLSATSNKWTLTVQEQPITFPPETPLPTGYWQRPIYGQNQGWYVIGGNWLAMNLVYGTGYDSRGCFNPYTTAPDSAHIIWTKYQTIGGIAGGDVGIGQYGFKSFLGGQVPTEGATYYTGLSYESRYGPPIVINGLLITQVRFSNAGSMGTRAINLRTGETVWEQNITVTCGQVLSYESPNQHGLFAYLWQTGNPYRMYDAMTGYLIMEFNNTSTGKLDTDSQGDLLVYCTGGNTTTRWLAMWNSSYAPYMQASFQGTGQWRPRYNTVQDWRAGVQWNVTISAIPGFGNPSLSCVSYAEGVVIGTVYNSTILKGKIIGYDAKTGNELWRTDDIESNQNVGSFTHIMRDGVIVFYRQELLGFYGYDLKSGRKLWGPTTPFENPFGLYTSSTVGLGFDNPNIAYGKLYAAGYDGTLHCYDTTTGTNLWNYYIGANPDSPFGQNPLGTGTWPIADGKCYVATGEHSPPSPLPLGAKMYCVDAESGKGLWDILGWYQCITVADGVLTAMNNYDGQIYAFAPGNSATTVQVPLTGIAAGDTITITGTVTDQSIGQTCLGIPAAGTPAISDESMDRWMEYLYMQQPKPDNATGVTVGLVAISTDGIVTDIGSVTSDDMGLFATHWTVPTTPGVYKIYANFAGTGSYYASSAETALTVVAAAPTAPTPASVDDIANAVVAKITPAPTVPSASDVAAQVASKLPSVDAFNIMIAVVAVLAVIVVVNTVLLLRKRKA